MDCRFIKFLILSSLVSAVVGSPSQQQDGVPKMAPPCNEDGIYPNFDDCHTYLQCSGGQRFIMPCPRDTIWNLEDAFCDRAENTECVQYQRGSGVHHKTPVCDEDAIFPNFSDCRTYWQCANGQAFIMYCPEGLIWNVEGSFCDWPANTECMEHLIGDLLSR